MSSAKRCAWIGVMVWRAARVEGGIRGCSGGGRNKGEGGRGVKWMGFNVFFVVWIAKLVLLVSR